MQRLVLWIQAVALTSGGPGLFILSFLDSSFLSFPLFSDLLVISMVTQHKERLVYYALAPTLGSVAGCLILYYIARAGGEAFMRKRFQAHHVEGGLKRLQDHGVMAVAVPAILPPPAPFKIFVLLAGVAEIPVSQFAAGIFIARLVRYGLEGILAVFYGEAVAAFVRTHARQVGIYGLVLMAAAALAFVWWNRRNRL